MPQPEGWGMAQRRARSRTAACIDPFGWRLLYSQRDPVPVPSAKEFAAMTETEQEEVREKKGGKRKLLALLALIGAVIAAMAFWRRRGAEEEEEASAGATVSLAPALA